MSRVLVAGVYPPVPGRASAAALDTVRRLVAEGHDVEVVSPRPSAAHHFERLSGPGTGGALARLAKLRHAEMVVLCLSPGVPFEPGAGARAQRATARRLAEHLRPFPAVRVVIAEDPHVPGWALARLWTVVDEITVAASDPAPARRRWRMPAPRVRIAEGPWADGVWPTPGPVTVSGPPDGPPGPPGGGRHRRLAAAVHRFRVIVGPFVRPVLYRVRAARARRRDAAPAAVTEASGAGSGGGSGA